jgi:hypothetical protein
VLDKYVQQWSALQTARAARLPVRDVFMAYYTLSGNMDEFHVEGYLTGLLMLPAVDRDLIAHAINETLDVAGSTADGAHYSDTHAAVHSGYEEYLRDLTLSPDLYDFTAPPVGDHSTSATTTDQETVAEGSGEDGFDEDTADDDALDDVEFRRCHALYESGLLDSGAEERFDRITRQARDYFGVSSASIALITEDAQVIKSVVGPIGQDLPRDLAICSKTIEHHRTLVITDASNHPDWQDHALVTDGPKVRFYAGHPVSTTGGWLIGTLCLIDDRPRDFTLDDVQMLKRFAAQVEREMWV